MWPTQALLRRKWRTMELRDFDKPAKEELTSIFLKNRGRNLSTSQLLKVVEAPQTVTLRVRQKPSVV